MKHQQNASHQLSIQTAEQAYQISFWKAASIMGGAIIVSIVGTAFTFLSGVSNDHFLTVSNTDRISAIEKTTVRQDVLVEQLAPMRADILEIKADIKLLVREQNAK